MARFRVILKSTVRVCADYIWPPMCAACETPIRDVQGLCARCWDAVTFLSGPACEACGVPFEYDLGPGALCGDCTKARPPFQRARAAFIYDDASAPTWLQSWRRGYDVRRLHCWRMRTSSRRCRCIGRGCCRDVLTKPRCSLIDWPGCQGPSRCPIYWCDENAPVPRAENRGGRGSAMCRAPSKCRPVTVHSCATNGFCWWMT